MEDRIKVILRNFDPYFKDSKIILDLGCGDGSTLMQLVPNISFKRLYGVDVNSKDLKKANSRGVITSKLNLDDSILPYESNYFDLVFMIEVIEHLINLDHILIEVKRVLKPSGYLVVTTPNLGWYVNRLILLLGYQPYYSDFGKYNVGKYSRPIARARERDREHYMLFTARALVEFLDAHGFDVIKRKGATANPLKQPLRRFDKYVSRLRWSQSQDLVVLARAGLSRNS